MAESVCKGCGGIIDFGDIASFTVCECSECGTEVVVPLPIGSLRLERQLGSLSVFEIYEGFDLETNLDSVIYLQAQGKSLAPELLAFSKGDASTLGTLKHVNISPVTNSGEAEGRFFVTEPLMDGSSLSEYLPDEGEPNLDLDKVVDVVQSSMVGLAVAHHKELPHHGIRPENIHIDARGNVRIKNFFISRFIDKLEGSCKAEDSLVPADYISPERVERGVEDKRGDVFACGVMLFHLLTGRFPFSGRNKVEQIYSRIYKKAKASEEIFNSTAHRLITPETVDYVPPPIPQELNQEIGPRLGNLIYRMLDPQAFKRPTLPEALDVISLFKAQRAQERDVQAAQVQMVRMDYMTRTRALPKMTNLANKLKEQRAEKKKKFFF